MMRSVPEWKLFSPNPTQAFINPHYTYQWRNVQPRNLRIAGVEDQDSKEPKTQITSSTSRNYGFTLLAHQLDLGCIHTKAVGVERLANQRLHFAADEVSDWLDARC
ncbi:hypothetical protein TNCV_1099701 [Trichonephila clavipes]|nr:hypothetical protein TNCV_1099701 [Trichonephila clavipes]